MKIYKNVDQRERDWFDLRRGIITASEASDLLSGKVGFEVYCLKKFAENFLETAEVNQSSALMRRGIELEPEAIDYYSEESLERVEDVGFIYNEELNIGCSPDSIKFKSGGEIEYGLEVKCFNKQQHIAAMLSNELGVKEYNQVQFSLLTTGAPVWKIVYYNPDFLDGMKMVVIDVLPDEVKHDKIKKAINIYSNISIQFKKLMDERRSNIF